MFHVPGWSVSASSLKTQQIEKKSTAGSKPTEPTTNQTTSDTTSRPSKKRKRAQSNSAAVNVTADNLVALWEKYIEGKTASHVKASRVNGSSTDPNKADKKRRKEQKQNEKANNEGNGEYDIPTQTPDLSKEKFEKRKSLKQKRREKQAAGDLPPSRPPTSASPTHPLTQPSRAPPSAPPAPPATKLTPLQASMRQKLISARFRHLNQTLYTTPSTHSLSLFAQNPQMFDEYHEGFRRQVGVWPENPVDGYIKTIQERGKQRFESQKGRFRKENKPSKRASENIEGAEQGNTTLLPLPRTASTCTIADLGCGDALLSQTLATSTRKLKLKILSFDLHSTNPLVTKADIAHLPLADGSVDVAIFCLALMGTNWIDFVEEAWRVLRWKGELWVAEIKSRFGRVGLGKGKGGRIVEHSVGNKKKVGAKRKAADDDNEDDDARLLVEVDGVDTPKQETDVSAFVEVLCKRGFALKSEHAVDLSNKMFVKMEFVKALTPIRGKGLPDAPRRGEGDGSTGGERKKWAKTRFLESAEDGDEHEGEEGKVLKPCVYKLR
ncbi:MAG: 25S rRNA (adenine645-N1)-methyltransferase [Pleopsidium flavum]|nr:MAG: 25S rRNA (adenine645-N1)-methyltransferase [Pleopsidium flavum]